MSEYLESLAIDTPDPLLSSIKEQALTMKVPIIKTETLAFIEQLIMVAKAELILEIGGGIGYFAIQVVKKTKTMVTSIEIDEGLHKVAKANIEASGLASKITSINADALALETSSLGLFDMIFVDGAKGKYRAYFDKFKDILKVGGFFVFDNLLFRGQVANPETILSRNRRQLVNKIKSFNTFIMNALDYRTEIYPLGDGIALAIKLR